MLCNSPHGSGKDNLLPLLDGREATVPLLLAWCADDDMIPEHLQAAEDDSGGNGGQRLGNHSVTGQGSQKLKDHVVKEVVEHGDLETTEARPWAGYGHEVLDGCPDLGSNGLSLDVEELGLGGA